MMDRLVRFQSLAILAALLFNLPSLTAQDRKASERPQGHVFVHTLKVTILSTNLADDGIGEWGFAALVEAGSYRVLVDTGARSETVLHNAQELHIDLSSVNEVVLTHGDDDHIGGLMTLRKELMKSNPAALSRVHVARGIFYSRPSAEHVENNAMITLRKEFEATGGQFIEHEGPAQIFSGVWLTGPVPRIYPEKNWSGRGLVQTPAGLVEDTVPEDQSLVVETPDGMVVICGCCHAGIVNTMTLAHEQISSSRVYAVLGGIHLFSASDQQVAWTADEMKQFGVAYLLGAHCTGIESVYQIRERLHLPRGSAVVAAVGSTFVLSEGIHPGLLAK